ncbi:CPBP family intramembrane glutamic endopeptidase [Fructobacillus evanidus]|uniref:CAAX protease family (YdiL) n=1 Tax=Fructobacillus evanidus TaxID=3064281 RepID=A0ABM9MUK1_9LACO|nr:CAAX protease family (YdiL) [Fructobacillus sp. LMG 32999]CAK1237653.1 CAAX protease family (YdiL) [Fructobacillus sp. LMG 32999]CAK1241208.1 CAAX protease family (YdiL) [Fructobacillus sp. LMG 32999]CAK1245153.1 CAAX protease family (YdiL) [Fructobacillus sp. LMG 32999]CAK1246307.1 CAAX protease family (YdiL) [Fructobacillus sp. LMG 32999]
MSFEPGYPDIVSFGVTIVLSVLLSVVLIIDVYLIRKVANQEKIYQEKLPLSKSQKFLTLCVLLYFVVIYAINGNLQSVFDLFEESPKMIISCTMVALGAGFFEEYLFRGYLVNLTQRILNRFKIQRNRLIIISISTSLAFSALHLSNLSINSSSSAVYQQVVYTFALGLVFMVFRVLTNSILVAAVAHFLLDWQSTITGNLEVSPWSDILLTFLPLIVIAIVWLVSVGKTIERKQILELKP